MLNKYSLVVVMLLTMGHVSTLQSAREVIRPASKAGSFYPADPTELSKAIDTLLGNVSTSPIAGTPKALIVPHAGYAYSGKTAANAYKTVEGKQFDTVILVGPYHNEPFKGANIWGQGFWETPLGRVPIDSMLAQNLISSSPLFKKNYKIHLEEHSLEVQLPFLQKTLGNFKLLPILINDQDSYKELAHALFNITKDKNILIVISTDMSHFHSYDTAKAIDAGTLDLINSGDTLGLETALNSRKAELCGGVPVLTMLELSKLLKTEYQFLNYLNSGDTAASKDRVVGYMSAAFYEPISSQGTHTYTEQQKDYMRDLAWKSLKHYLETGKGLKVSPPQDSALNQNRAVFVTLRKSNGHLRGCIGRTTAEEPLYKAVQNMTVESAILDSRFSKVQSHETNDLSLKISVLSPRKPVKNAKSIILGKHGVVLVYDGIKRGVFLPSVATETGWTKEKFLSELCIQKSGLNEKCWLDPRAQLLVFTTEEF